MHSLALRVRHTHLGLGDRRQDRNVDTVELNNYDAGSPIARHMYDLGHKPLAYISTTLDEANPIRTQRLQGLRDTFGQGYLGKREGFVNLLEWLAALGNAEGMQEWAADSEAARMLAGRLRNDHA